MIIPDGRIDVICEVLRILEPGGIALLIIDCDGRVPPDILTLLKAVEWIEEPKVGGSNVHLNFRKPGTFRPTAA